MTGKNRWLFLLALSALLCLTGCTDTENGSTQSSGESMGVISGGETSEPPAKDLGDDLSELFSDAVSKGEQLLSDAESALGAD